LIFFFKISAQVCSFCLTKSAASLSILYYTSASRGHVVSISGVHLTNAAITLLWPYKRA